MKLIAKCIYTFVLLISLINTSDIYAQAKGSANVVAIPFNIDPDAKERINEMWIRNFVDARLNYNPATYNAMTDIVITGIMDRDGNLWFGTNEKGLFFFDGKPGKDGRIEFQNFTTNDGLGSNTAWCSYMDKNGILWFGTKGGVTKFDGRAFKIIPIPLASGKKVNVLSISQDKMGQYWFGTEGEGVYRYDGKNFKQYIKNVTSTSSERKNPNVVSTISADSKGNMWFGSSQGGVFFLPYVSLKSPESISKSFINYSPKASGKLVSFSTMDSKKSMTEDMVLKITEDKNGFIWLGTRNNGVFRFDGKTFTNINKLNGLPNNNVSTIYEDKDGNMWFGCDIPDGVTKGGIARLDKKLLNSANKKITEMPTRKGLPNSGVRTILQDKEGNMWFGSRGGGLVRFNGKEMTDFSFYLSRGGC